MGACKFSARLWNSSIVTSGASNSQNQPRLKAKERQFYYCHPLKSVTVVTLNVHGKEAVERRYFSPNPSKLWWFDVVSKRMAAVPLLI